MRTYGQYYGTSTASPAYSDGDIAAIINNTNTDNLNWCMKAVNDSLRYLTMRYFWNEKSVQLYTSAGVQFYPIPPQAHKIVNITLLIGNVLWQPRQCTSRTFWDALNVIQFQQEYPYYYFIWGGQIGVWPVPTVSTDLITINYKSRLIDLSMPDVTDQTSTFTVSTNQPITVASYSSSNQNSQYNLNAGDILQAGESFSSGTDETLTSAQFYIKKTGTPTGNAWAFLYAHSGTFGTSSVPQGISNGAPLTPDIVHNLSPLGEPLAVSEPVDVSTLTTSYAMTTFNFEGSNQIKLFSGTDYIIQIQYIEGDSSNNIQVGLDASGTGIPGNANYYTAANGWTPESTKHLCYTVSGLPNPTIITASGNAFTNWMGESGSIRIPYTSSNSTSGDNQWYSIAEVLSPTQISLNMPYTGPTVTGAPFTVGQTPSLIEEYQDLPLYRMGEVYYTIRYPDPVRAQYFKSLYDEGFAKLDAEFSSKGTNVVLSDMDQPMVNPNQYIPKVSNG